MALREAINDRGKLMFHRLVARRLRSEPALRDDALRLVDSWRDEGLAESYVAEWRELLDLPDIELTRMLCGRDRRMTRLRRSSPFAVLPAFTIPDDGQRRKLWCLARRDARAPLGI
jgi:hypothetical protein